MTPCIVSVSSSHAHLQPLAGRLTAQALSQPRHGWGHPLEHKQHPRHGWGHPLEHKQHPSCPPAASCPRPRDPASFSCRSRCKSEGVGGGAGQVPSHASRSLLAAAFKPSKRLQLQSTCWGCKGGAGSLVPQQANRYTRRFICQDGIAQLMLHSSPPGGVEHDEPVAVALVHSLVEGLGGQDEHWTVVVGRRLCKCAG